LIDGVSGGLEHGFYMVPLRKLVYRVSMCL